MANIKIYKRIHGSLTTRKGDGVLGYTEDYSDRTKLVSSVIDNPPVLSPNYATAIWRYYKNTDRYMFIHIQGSRFLFSDRNYPYRAAFEVDRKELRGLAKDYLPLGSVIERMPVMVDEYTEATFKNLKVEETVTVKKSSATTESVALADAVLQSIIERKRLCINIGQVGDSLKNNGVRESVYFQTMIAAIESLPAEVAQYVSFGVCVDDNHAKFLDDVMVMFYAEEKPFTVPEDAKNINWNELTATSAKVDTNIIKAVLPSLPNGDSSLLGLTEMMETLSDSYTRFNTVGKKDAKKVRGDEWKIRILAHPLSSIQVQSWEEFEAIYRNMPIDIKKKFAQLNKKNSLEWPLDEKLIESLLASMNYSDEEKQLIQNKALGEYLKSNCTSFAFLFPKEDNFNFSERLNAPFLKSLGLKSRKDVDRWYNIFKDKKCLSSSVKKEFLILYKGVEVRTLKSAVELLAQINEQGLEKLRLADLNYKREKIESIEKIPAFHDSIISKLSEQQQAEVVEYQKALVNDFISTKCNNLDALEDLIKGLSGESKGQCEYVLDQLSDANKLKPLFNTSKKPVLADACERMLVCRDKLSKKKDALRKAIENVVREALQDTYFTKLNAKTIQKICKELIVYEKNDKWLKYGKTYTLLCEMLKGEICKLDKDGITDIVNAVIEQNEVLLANPLYEVLEGNTNEESSDFTEECVSSLKSSFADLGKKKNVQKADNSSDGGKLDQKKVLLLAIIAILVVVLGVVVYFAFFKKDSPTPPEKPLTTINANDSVNVMLTIANDTLIGEKQVVFKDSTKVNFNYTEEASTTELLKLDSIYLSRSEMYKDSMLVQVDSLGKTSELKVNANQSLLKQVAGKNYKIESVLIKGKRIELDNADDRGPKDNTLYMKYYLDLIKKLEGNLKADSINASIAY